MPEPPASSPDQIEPQDPQKKSASFLPIAIILGVFFLLVFVIAVLMLPDHGKKLLKLAEANPVTAINPPYA